MPSFNPVIVPFSVPAILITMSGTTTYQQFKSSLGQYVYLVEKFYLFSPNQAQIQGGFFYNKYDSNGRANNQTILSTIDPYQSATSIYVQTDDKKLIIDGRDSVKFNILPNTSLSIKLYCDRLSNGDELDAKGMNNFKDLERIEGELGFFDQYREFI